MLKTPAPFPFVGSWALLDESRATMAVRIIERDGPDAVISIGGEFGASGNRRLPIAALRNADALSAEEKAELAALERRLTGKKRRASAIGRRAEELKGREISAKTLAFLLAKVPARHPIGPAAAAKAAA